MEQIASVNLHKGKSAYFVYVLNLREEGSDLLFHFDTGASVSLIGLNTICEDDEERTEILKQIIENEIAEKGVKKYSESLKTATKEEIEVYPCKCDEVTLLGGNPATFYFHIYLGTVNLPLLGFDYIDDCSFHHSIQGNVHISAVSESAGKRFYTGNVIDFNSVMKKYREQLHMAD